MQYPTMKIASSDVKGLNDPNIFLLFIKGYCLLIFTTYYKKSTSSIKKLVLFITLKATLCFLVARLVTILESLPPLGRIPFMLNGFSNFSIISLSLGSSANMQYLCPQFCCGQTTPMEMDGCHALDQWDLWRGFCYGIIPSRLLHRIFPSFF